MDGDGQMMKKWIVVLALAVMGTTHAFAAPKPEAAARLGEQAQLMSEMKSLTEEYRALEADEKIQVQRNKDLSWGAEQYKRKLGDFESAGRKFDADVATYNRNLADHNRRCAGAFESQSYVDACNAAARAGAATKAELAQRGDYLNTTGKQLDELRRVTSEESQKVFAKHKANVARMDEVALRHDALLDRLKQIRGEVKKCKDAISSGSREEMHDVCGEMFDGNK
jgi:chromosome segregation ATPase